MRARQMCRRAQVPDGFGGLLPGIIELAINDEDAVAQNFADRHGHGVVAACGGLAGVDRCRKWIVDSHCDPAVIRDLIQQLLFDRSVSFHGSMAIQMIGRQIGQNRCIGGQPRRQVDLIGRSFQNIDGGIFRRLQVQYGTSDITTRLRIKSAGIQHMCNQRRGGGFSVGAGDRHNRSEALCPRSGTDGPGEQFDVANHFCSAFARAAHHRMRLRMRQSNAGAEDQRCDCVPGP